MAEGLGISGSKSLLNIAASTVIAVTTASSYAGRRIARVNVIVAGTTVGTINDALTVAQAAVASQVFSIPNTVGSYQLDFPMFVGIVVVTGTGQTVSVSYD